MTPAQRSLYWREFAAVQRVYPDADRHELHAQALGEDKSSSDFTNGDLDKVLATFRAISRPDDFSGQMRQVQQPVTRALYGLDQAMRCLSLYVEDPIAYREAIMASFFRGKVLSDLRPDQIHTLRMTIWARVNGAGGMRDQAGHTVHQMKELAGVPCDCRACRMAAHQVEAAR